jgi:hypothetical protein
MIGVKQDILFSLKKQLIKVIQLINKTNQRYIPCHEYILQCYDKFPYDHFFLANWISRSLESSSVTFSLDDTYGHLHVTCARVSSDLPCLYISGEQVRKMIEASEIYDFNQIEHGQSYLKRECAK